MKHLNVLTSIIDHEEIDTLNENANTSSNTKDKVFERCC